MSLLYTTEYSTSRAAGRNKAYIKNHGGEASRSFATWTATEDIELLKYYQKNYPTVVILSAIGSTSHSKEIEQAKRDWLKEHVGDITAHFVNKTEYKFEITQLYPSFTTHILIDDRDKSIIPWIANGGVGVLFV